MKFSTDFAYAQALDAGDELAHFRERFVVEDPDLIYLDGNSLGRMPKATKDHINTLLDEYWGQRLIRMWNDGWFNVARTVGQKMARVVGAQPNELVMADSTTVNLFKLALAAVLAQPNRHKIITDDLNFPSDHYVLQGLSQMAQRPLHVQIVRSPDGIYGPVAELAQAVDDDTALVTLSHTVFKSGYTYDMTAVNQLAHRHGALVLWDLSHSAGAVPVQLSQSNADLAVGCSYKYMNGGPGAPAFLYVRQDWQEKLHNPIAGWMGKNNMFDFAIEYEPLPGVSRFLSGTPPVLSMAAVEPGVDLILEAGIDRLRAKSVRQSEYLIALWEALLAPLGFSLNSPREAQWRGSHISLGHADGWRIDQALIHEMNVLPDFRPPDNIRLGITPLYTSFAELHTAVHRLRRVMTDKLYEKYKFVSQDVT